MNGPDAIRELHFPEEMLDSKALSREIEFSTKEAITNLKLV